MIIACIELNLDIFNQKIQHFNDVSICVVSMGISMRTRPIACV